MAENETINDEVQLVVFRLGQEEYGVSIMQVQEIKKVTEITRVPYTQPYIKGVINLRGSVLPVMDLRLRLSLPQTDYTEDTRIMIAKVNDTPIGMIVDAVSEVMTLSQNQIEPPQSIVSGIAAQYLSGVGKQDNRLIIMLNLDEIISGREAIKTVQANS